MNKKQKKQLISLGAAAFIAVTGYFGIDLTQNNSTNSNTGSITTEQISDSSINPTEAENLEPNGHYTEPQDVAAFLQTFEELPENYITKDEAHDLGWEPDEGNLHDVAPGASIGGDHFGNFEELLPEENGREYREADVNYDGGYRGSERLVFSNDGLIFYTDDHYKSFEQVD